MKITVELEVFDDQVYCEGVSDCCDYLEYTTSELSKMLYCELFQKKLLQCGKSGYHKKCAECLVAIKRGDNENQTRS